MGRIADIDAEMHELPDYEKGIRAERERIIKLLEKQAAVTGYVEIELGKLIALIQNIDNSNIHTTVDNEINVTSKSVLRRLTLENSGNLEDLRNP